MTPYEVTTKMNLKPLIAETREFIQALEEFADKIEDIDAKYDIECRTKEGSDTE